MITCASPLLSTSSLRVSRNFVHWRSRKKRKRPLKHVHSPDCWEARSARLRLAANRSTLPSLEFADLARDLYRDRTRATLTVDLSFEFLQCHRRAGDGLNGQSLIRAQANSHFTFCC